jgi:hypothetical protein
LCAAIPWVRQIDYEVIIREAVPAPKIDMENIGCVMSGSITQSLIGIVPNSGKTLDDYINRRPLKRSAEKACLYRSC